MRDGRSRAFGRASRARVSLVDFLMTLVRYLVLKHGCRRWRHKFRTHSVPDRLGENLVDLLHGVGVELPSHHLVDRCELVRTACSPKCDNLAAIEQPSDGEREHRLPVALAREAVEPGDRL